MTLKGGLSSATTQRMPSYLRYLKDKEEACEYISSVTIAEEMGLSAILVKKDISAIHASEGKPKMGYKISELIEDIEKFLGYDNAAEAILVGAGKLGTTLLSYNGFKNYGLNIVAAFDSDIYQVGKSINGKKVWDVSKLVELNKQRFKVKMGIITVPKEDAQHVAELMVEAGILAIWNFAPTNIRLPDNITVKNEDMAASLALLSIKLRAID